MLKYTKFSLRRPILDVYNLLGVCHFKFKKNINSCEPDRIPLRSLSRLCVSRQAVLPFRVYHAWQGASSSSRGKYRGSDARLDARSASQKIKHLYSAEIFQRRLDSFLISFMAGRNITPDLLPPTAIHHHSHFVLALARAHHSRAAAASLPFPRFSSLSSWRITNARRVRVGGTSSGVRSTNVLRAARKHAICLRYSS